jgi:murein DD-endopeptidase MepM/ murein hydrolase activator NlpD
MRFVFAWIASMAVALSQGFEVVPQAVKQGETLRAHGGTAARFNGRTVRVFSQPDGSSLGLVPIPVRATPGRYKIDFLDEHGAVAHTTEFLILNAHYPRQNIVISKALLSLKPSPGEQEAVKEFKREVLPVRYWQEPLEPPIPGCMTSLFGVQRYQNGKPTGDYHAGIDQRGVAGSPVHAIAGGVVKLVRQFNLRGGTIAINHGQGLESIYLHMSKFAMEEGHEVKQGEVIGYVGSSGRSTAPHLHWTLYANGEPVNPLQWLKLVPCAAPPKPSTSKKTPPKP